MANYDRNAYAPYAAGMGRTISAAQYDQGLRSYMLGIYNHMAIALAISGLVAIGTFMLGTSTNAAGRMALTPLGQAIWVSPLKWVIMLAPLAFVFLLSFRWERMSLGALLGTFYAFSAVMGLSLSSVFVIFKLGSIAQVFFITAATFATLSVWGYVTKKDLSGWGTFLFMGMIGLIIASLVNLGVSVYYQTTFPVMQFVISAIGLLIFAGFTAYDTQQIKDGYYELVGDTAAMSKGAVMGALNLYIDFIGIFQSLLSLMGDRD